MKPTNPPAPAPATEVERSRRAHWPNCDLWRGPGRHCTCKAPLPDPDRVCRSEGCPLGVDTECALPEGHAGHHRDDTGRVWEQAPELRVEPAPALDWSVECSGCGLSRAACPRWDPAVPGVACCPDCKHEPRGGQ